MMCFLIKYKKLGIKNIRFFLDFRRLKKTYELLNFTNFQNIDHNI